MNEQTDKEIDDIFGLLLQFEETGGFLTRFMLAWRHADSSNQMILKGAALRLIQKYKLKDRVRQIIRTNPITQQWSDEYLSEVDDEKLLT